ncbi:MAG: hypothetical protein Q8R37_03460 [Nanoarchaeota archaeon]|nr:hypothetical protein [Nanoarchaeota archaeon]
MRIVSRILVVVLVTVLLVLTGCSKNSAQDDAFATCLTEKGVTMYGAYWCPHCQEQKKMFGGSWDKVEYIECSLPNRAGETAICNQAGITSYPTWQFADGTRKSGTLSLEDLSFFSGCALKE